MSSYAHNMCQIILILFWRWNTGIHSHWFVQRVGVCQTYHARSALLTIFQSGKPFKNKSILQKFELFTYQVLLHMLTRDKSILQKIESFTYQVLLHMLTRDKGILQKIVSFTYQVLLHMLTRDKSILQKIGSFTHQVLLHMLTRDKGCARDITTIFLHAHRMSFGQTSRKHITG
jgi:hypothetical protein